MPPPGFPLVCFSLLDGSICMTFFIVSLQMKGILHLVSISLVIANLPHRTFPPPVVPPAKCSKQAIFVCPCTHAYQVWWELETTQERLWMRSDVVILIFYWGSCLPHTLQGRYIDISSLHRMWCWHLAHFSKVPPSLAKCKELVWRNIANLSHLSLEMWFHPAGSDTVPYGATPGFIKVCSACDSVRNKWQFLPISWSYSSSRPVLDLCCAGCAFKLMPWWHDINGSSLNGKLADSLVPCTYMIHMILISNMRGEQ